MLNSMTNLRFIFADGPGAGKTTVLESLSRQGFQTGADSAREIIRNRLAAGLSPRPSSKAFAEAILSADIDQYDRLTPTTKPVFFERGICDVIAMLKEHLPASAVDNYLAEYPYNRSVFIFPPWEEIYRTDAERDHTFEHAERVYDGTRRWYHSIGYQTMDVPPASVDSRVSFVLEQVDLSLR